jgi:hypothetical protein
MTRICVCLVAAIALSGLAPASFAAEKSPPAHRHHAHRHHHGATRITIRQASGRYFGADPDRYFGIGPGSYECFGYDCNW